MGLVSMLYSYPRQNFYSTSPLFSKYTSWQGDCVSGEQQGMLLKLCLRSEQSMETNSIYTSSGYPKNVDNSKQIRLSICKELHISSRISFERETPNRVTCSTNMHDTEKRGVLCLTSLSRKQEKPQPLQGPRNTNKQPEASILPKRISHFTRVSNYLYITINKVKRNKIWTFHRIEASQLGSQKQDLKASLRFKAYSKNHDLDFSASWCDVSFFSSRLGLYIGSLNFY